MREGRHAGIAGFGGELLDRDIGLGGQRRPIAAAMHARWHRFLKLSCVSDENNRDKVRADVPTLRASVSISPAKRARSHRRSLISAIGIVMGAFGQVTVNDAMVGKYTSEEWRSRAYAVRYFVGFTAAGVSGPGGMAVSAGWFRHMLHAFAGSCLPVIAAAVILPAEINVPAAGANRAPAVVLSGECRRPRAVAVIFIQHSGSAVR